MLILSLIYFLQFFSAPKPAEKVTSTEKSTVGNWKVEFEWTRIVVQPLQNLDLDVDAIKRLALILGRWKIGPSARIRAEPESSTEGSPATGSTLTNGSILSPSLLGVTRLNGRRIFSPVRWVIVTLSTLGGRLFGNPALLPSADVKDSKSDPWPASVALEPESHALSALKNSGLSGRDAAKLHFVKTYVYKYIFYQN